MIIHHSISDLYNTLQLPYDEELEFTILSIPDIHPQIPFVSPKLKAEYFSFILTKDGAGTYYLDEREFPFGPNSFYFTNPGHIKSYELEYSNSAYIVTLSDKFLREHIRMDIYEEFPFLLAENMPPKTLNRGDFEEFELLYSQILKAFNGNSRFKNKILGNLIMILFLNIKEKICHDYDPRIEGKRDSQIVKSFKRVLYSPSNALLHNQDEVGIASLQVQDIAKHLNLHPNYLNSVIKSKTGRTVNSWIRTRTLSLAKYLLKNTALSSKQISYRLGFREPTHFSRFSRKMPIKPQRPFENHQHNRFL